MRVMIVGHGAREHAIARRLVQDGHEVLACAARENAGLLRDCDDFVLVPSYSGAEIAKLAVARGVDLLLPADEAALFDGVTDASTELGVPCFGHPRKTALFMEGMRHEVISLLKPGRYARPPSGRLIRTRREWLSMPASEMVVAKPVSSDARAQGVSFVQPGGESKIALPAWVEPYKAGVDFSIHYLALGGQAVYLGLTFDYPFLSKKSFTLTGGMGSLVPGRSDETVVPDALLDECKAMAENLIRSISEERRLDVRGFVSAQFRKVRQHAIFTELDCKPGNPEIIALLPTLEGDLGEALLEAAQGTAPQISTNGLASIAISMSPASYPYPSSVLLTKHNVPASLLASETVFFGETSMLDLAIRSGESRTICVTGCGANIEEARGSAKALATEIRMDAGLVFRDDVGSGVLAGATERVRKSLQVLKTSGGKRVMLRLSPEANKTLRELLEKGDFKNETEAINAAVVRLGETSKRGKAT